MANEMLIRGAAHSARSKGSGDLAATTAAMDLSKHLSDGISTVVQARNRHFNSAMKAELEKTGDMSDKEYKAYEKKLRKQRFAYVYLNKRGRVAMEQEVAKEADNVKKIKDLNDKIANVPIEDPSRDLGSCNADAVAKIVKGDMGVVYDKEGRPGYNMPTGRECFAAEQEELREFVQFDENNDAKLASYVNAWDDGRFSLSEDGQTKTDKFGNQYPNTKEGYQQFVDASEKYWKEQHEKTKKQRELDVDTQTGKKSTHAVWEQGNQNEFNSPMKMKPMEDDGQDISDDEGEEEDKSPEAGENFMALDDIGEMVKNAGVDDNSFKAIESVVANSAITAEKIQVGENNEFNYKKNYNNIRQQIVAKGNLRSLAQNTNPFGRVFIDDLSEAIMTSSYEELGVKIKSEIVNQMKSSYEELGVNSAKRDKGKLEAMDPTPKTPINIADAQVIVRTIYNNPKMLMDYVSEYYTNFAEQNFNDNLKPEVAQNFDHKLTYEEAFNSARKRFGPNKSFTYRNRIYKTNVEQDTAKDENEFA